jgi:HAD superfamily phosphatase (TIGR01668 family)
MSLYQKCIPDFYYQSIFEIPYQTLKEQGISTLFFDLDNTIIGYDENILSEEQIDFINDISKSFKVVILSNSGKIRVSKALSNTNFDYVYHATKPFKFGFKKALKISQSKKDEVMVIGDQMMTDILGAHRINIKATLIKSVKRKSDRKITQFNRKIEKYILKRIKKKYPKLYISRLEKYVTDH